MEGKVLSPEIDREVVWLPSILARAWAPPLLIAALAITLNLAGNARTGLWDRDEPRYAVAVREMRARGDWIVPTYNGEPRYHKPILIYWLMRAGTGIWGDGPFGVRFASSLAGAGTCLAAWALGRRMLGPGAGLLAGLMLAVSPIMVAESKLATPDAALCLCLIICQVCLRELTKRPSWRYAAAFWTCLGLATLIKGPVGPAILAVSAMFARWWGWPASDALGRLHWRRGAIGFLLIVTPWYLAVAIVSRGEFFQVALGTQVIQRISSSMEHHGGFPGYYLALSTLVFYPWSTLIPAAVLAAWRHRRTDPDIGFLLGWAIGPLVLLECIQTRLIHYYLPAYPACAILVAWLVKKLVAEGIALRRQPLGRLAAGMLGGIAMLATVSLLAGAWALPSATRLPLLCLALAIGVGSLLSILRLYRAETDRACLGLVATWAVAMFGIGGWLIPAAEPFRNSRVIGSRLAAWMSQTGLEPLLLNYQEPGLIYALGRTAEQVRDPDDLIGLLNGRREMITVLTAEESDELRSTLGIETTPLEEFEGFSLTKAKRHNLRIARIRRGTRPSSPSGPLPAGLARRRQDTLVE